MFCPKCGIQNPDSGRFCRSCGSDLGGVSAALSGQVALADPKDKKGRAPSWESALTKFFMGIAFLGVAIALAFTPTGGAWWFWLLIPAFSMLGSGIAQIIQVRKSEAARNFPIATENVSNPLIEQPARASLPVASTDFVAPPQASIYDTGEIVGAPPSVTEPTTKLLEMDAEGETMTLPNRD